VEKSTKFVGGRKKETLVEKQLASQLATLDFFSFPSFVHSNFTMSEKGTMA
jgi:hypothetical protein